MAQTMTKKARSKAAINDAKSIELREYAQVLADVKKRIQEAQVKAVLSASKELIKLYWYIGEVLAEKQKQGKWGTSVIENFAKDLQSSFPGMGGFSRANLFKMRALYLAYEKVSQAVRQFEDTPIFNIPWGHNVILLTKLKDTDERFWYAQKAIEHGWSRSMLEIWIESNLYHREGKALNNFQKTLPTPQSDMAQQSFKDPYIFNFLTLEKQYIEKDVEQGLIDNIQKFLLELGKGFALVGRQYRLEVEDKDYYVDLMFYHIQLRCYIAIELKARDFDPGDIGQLNFYLAVIDDKVKGKDDNPTIGLLLCKTKNNVVAEYALRNIRSPIGVSQYMTEILNELPEEFKSSLPTIEEIEAELEKQEILLEEKK